MYNEKEQENFLDRYPLLKKRLQSNQPIYARNTETQSTQETPSLSNIGKDVGTAVGKEALKSEATKQVASQAGTEGLGGILANAGQMGAGPISAIAAGTYLGGKSAYDTFIKGKEDKSISGKIGRGQLAIATGGLSEVGRAFGLGGRKTHKDYAEEMWGRAGQAAKTDVDRDAINNSYQQNLRQIDDVDGTGAVYQEGALTGRKWNWKDVKNTSRGTDIWGEYGFFQAFPDWISGYTEDQRKQIAEAALDHDLLTHDPKRGRLFSEKEGDLDAIQEIALQVKEGTYEPLYTGEERHQNRQEYLQMLFDTEGYESPELGMEYVEDVKERSGDGTDDDDIVQETSTVEEQRGQGSRKPLKRRPQFNDVPKAVRPEPTIRTPKDYAQAYLDVYNANVGRY